MSQDGNTPIHNAAHKGHVDVIKVLLEAKVDKDLPDKVGRGARTSPHRCGMSCPTQHASRTSHPSPADPMQQRRAQLPGPCLPRPHALPRPTPKRRLGLHAI